MLLSKTMSSLDMCRSLVSFPPTSKAYRYRFLYLLSTQNFRLPKPTMSQAMDTKTREATLHVSPVLRGGLTHQNEQRLGKCAVPAAKETTKSARHVAHHNSIMLSITSKSLINIHNFQKKLADLDMSPASRFPNIFAALAWP